LTSFDYATPQWSRQDLWACANGQADRGHALQRWRQLDQDWDGYSHPALRLGGGQLRVIADITDPELIRKILDHVQQRAPPRLPPRRAGVDS
jgi:hypothetical protein